MFTDETIVGAFAKVQAMRRQTAEKLVRCKILKRDDYKRSEILYGPRYGTFGHMEDGFRYGLISEVNRFLKEVHHADCWVQVANKYNEDDRLGLLSEFADPFLELSVGRPYSLRNQFTFAAVHLLHQTNSLKKNWNENDLPKDRDIEIRYLSKLGLGGGWKRFSQFQENLKALNDSDFAKKITKNYRHRLQHQLRLRFDTGLTPCVERILENGCATYVFKAMRPLELGTLIPMLYEQHKKAMKVFDAYWKLVDELYAEWTVQNQITRKSV